MVARRFRSSAVIAVAIAHFAAGAPLAMAQTSSADETTALQTFRRSLADISVRDHVGFVVEGEPHPIVLLRRTKNLAATTAPDIAPAPPRSVDGVVESLAESYDYSSTRRGNLYLLTKKYTYGSDTPEVTPEECFAAASDFRAVTQAISGNAGASRAGAFLSDLVGSLSPDQWTTLSTSHCLKMSDLTEVQRQDASKFILGQYTTSGDGFGVCYQTLGPKNHARFERNRAVRNADISVGYMATWLYDSKPQEVFRPITVSTNFGQTTPGGPIGPLADPEFNDTAVAAEKIATERAASKNSFHVEMTIAQAVDRLNERRAAQKPQTTDSKITFAVDPGLAAKPVTLVGDELASPGSVASAIAEIYGLRVRRAPNAPTVENITRLPVSKLDRPEDAGRIIHELLPRPLITALRVDREDQLRATIADNRANAAQGRRPVRSPGDAHQVIRQHRRRLMGSMARQLLAVLEPRLKPITELPNGEPESIALKSVDAYTQALYATYVLREFSDTMDGILYPPPTVTHFDELCLTCTADLSRTDNPKAMLGFCMYNDETHAPGAPIIYTSVPLPANAPAQQAQ